MTERTVARQTRLDDDAISLTSTVSETYAADDEFKVDRILAEKTQGSKKIYLIRWDGYPLEKSTWEPQKNIQDDDILEVWKERKLRESKGLDEPFNMSAFNALLLRLAEEKAQRHKRRKAKRRQLGKKVSPSESENEQADDSDSSIEAIEENELDDDPGMKTKAKKKAKSPPKKQPTATRPLNGRQGSGASDPDAARKTQERRGLFMSMRPSPEKIQPASRQASETSKHSRTLSQSSSDEPPSRGQLLRQTSTERQRSASQSSTAQPLSRKRSVQQKFSSNPRPGSSSSDGPLALQRPKPSLGSQATSMIGNEGTAKKTTPNTEPPAVPRGFPSMRGASIASRGKVATRGGANMAIKNVFQSREPPKKRGNLLQNAMDAGKAPKKFSNMRLRRKAELQARDIAERAPDISFLPGGLLDPSNPSSFLPIRPETLRRSSSNIVSLAETESAGQSADLDTLFLSRENTPAADDAWGPNTPQAAPPIESTMPVISRSTCYYWDRQQNDSNQPRCSKGDYCRFQHYYEAGMPIAPRPGTQGTDDASTAYITPQVPPIERSMPDKEGATCYFWDRAERDSNNPQCSRGTHCKYQHHYEEGMPIAPRPPHLRYTDDSRDPSTLDQPPWRNDVVSENTSQDAASPWRRGSEDTSKAEPTQMVSQQSATLVEITPDLRDVLQRLRTSAESSSSSPKEPTAQSPAQTIAPSTPKVKARPAWDPRHPQNAICYFWATQGKCSWGRECKYHHDNSPNLAVAPSPKEQKTIQRTLRAAASDAADRHASEHSPPERDPHGRDTCRFWLKNICKYNNDTCRFWHGPTWAKMQASSATRDKTREQAASPPVQATASGPRVKSVSFAIDESVPFVEEPESMSSSDRAFEQRRSANVPMIDDYKVKKGICFHWSQGDCHHGAKCWFRHEYAPGEEPNQGNKDVEMRDRDQITRNEPVVPKVRRSVTTSESLPTTIDEANIVPQSKSKRPNEEPSSEIPTSISDPPLLVPTVKRPKISMDDYRRKRPITELGGRTKEVTFGLDETQSLLLDFGDMTQTLESSWGVSFSSAFKVRFDQMCMAQDFQAQQGFLQRLGLWHGNLITAGPSDAEAVRSIDKVADELGRRSAGLLSEFSDFVILTFPAKKAEWEFLESTFEDPQDAKLRYFLFRCDLSIRRSLQMQPTSLALNAPYRDMLVHRIHRLDFKKLLPIGGKRPQKTPTFYLLFPSTASSTADFIISWLRSSNRCCRIYSSQSEGSWHFLTHTPEIDTGSILVHESAAAEIDRLPGLYPMLAEKNFAFWYISESSSPYPTFPSTYALDDSDMGRLSAIRLFPHGCAFLLTPSFLVAEPQMACLVVEWFLTVPKPKYLHSTPRTWKLVCCHNFINYALDLANSKAAEKDAFELKYRDDPAKDAKIEDKGLSFNQCKARYKLHKALVDFESRRSFESASEGYDYDSDYDDSGYPIVHAAKYIDPDDETALVNWFAAWSMRNLDMYKKFVVVGSSEKSAKEFPGRPRRMKEFRKDPVSQLPLPIPNFKQFSITTKKSIASPLESPLSPMTQKQKALAVAAKISASSPAKTVTNSRDLERNPFDDIVIQSASSPQQETTRNLAGANGNSTTHGIGEQLHPNIPSFSAITSTNAKEAEQFISKANSDVQAAVDLYNNASVDDQIIELITTSSTKKPPHLATADADAARARGLYDSPATTVPMPLSDSTNRGKPGTRSAPQFDGADDHYSPMGFDGTDDRPASSSSSRSGIQSDENGRRFVPRSVRPNSTIRKEIPVRLGYAPPEDGEIYQIPSQRGSATGTPSQSVASPGGDRMDVDSDGNASEMKRKSRWQVSEEEKVLKEIKFEATTVWYRKLREKGGGWEHILVAGWEISLNAIGFKKP